MATNENSIREGVLLLLEMYGSLTTTEVKNHLEEVINFDDEDRAPSPTRNESKIIQRIGNIVSHQNQSVEIYLGSYEVDKTSKPATWTLLNGLQGNQHKISSQKIKAKQNRKKSFKPHKSNWDAIKSEHEDLGRAGEEFVVRQEQAKIRVVSPADATRVFHLSAIQGDGAGFDVLSIDQTGKPISIEVKTTTGSVDSPFYMTENERQYFELNKNAKDLFIYRVYNFDISTNGAHAQIKKITPIELFNDYTFDPTTYKVHIK